MRGQDSNLRPSGYEPDELTAALPRKGKEKAQRMAGLGSFINLQERRRALLLDGQVTPEATGIPAHEAGAWLAVMGESPRMPRLCMPPLRIAGELKTLVL